jgi:phosphoribosylaminoimidazolecarboxamide formyltransferase/IMP cyclohydrolase
MRAVISVANQEGLVPLVQELVDLGVVPYASASAASSLIAAGMPVRSLSEITGAADIVGGPGEMLHPALYAAILARRGEPGHRQQPTTGAIAPIDIVISNLHAIAEDGANRAMALADIVNPLDAGHVALLQAAASNFANVLVLTRPADYPTVLAEWRVTGSVSFSTRRHLAAIAFQHIATHDTQIAAYLRSQDNELFPDEMTLALRKVRELRHGENPHQSAVFYGWGRAGAPATGAPEGVMPASDAVGKPRKAPPGQETHADIPPTIAGAVMLHGQELSFNHILDVDAALNTVASFTSPAAVIINHTNPCGLACDDQLVEAYKRAHAGDPVAAYGGVAGFNRVVDRATAEELVQLPYECIIAPGYTAEAMALLRQNQQLRILATGRPIGPYPLKARLEPGLLDMRRVSGGFLVQTPEYTDEQDISRQVVTERQPTFAELTDLLFAWKAVKHVKSNAIVLAKKLAIVGVGAGQSNRLYSVQIAVDRSGGRARGSVLAADAYFPFPDGIEAAAKAGVTAIIQPGGSIRDAEIIRVANSYAIAMIFTGQRHFRH